MANAETFKTKAAAEAFAKKKNKTVRKGKWITGKASHSNVYWAWHKLPGRDLIY